MEETMTQDLSFVPTYLDRRGSKIHENILSVLLGVLGLSLLAQIAIPLPWTPVPITGQTFGVSLMSLLWGRKRALSSVVIYLALGAVGLPIFALGKFGISLGPTTGYLIGMVLAAYWMGSLSDRGGTKTWWRTYLSAFSGSAIIFSCGVLGLSFFIPTESLLSAGVLPFLPGDLLKTLLASTIAFQTQKTFEAKG